MDIGRVGDNMLGYNGRIVSAFDFQSQARGFKYSSSNWLIKNHPTWATGDDNGALAHSAVNEYLAIDRDANFTCGTWKHVSGCILARQVQQVIDVMGLPVVITHVSILHIELASARKKRFK